MTITKQIYLCSLLILSVAYVQAAPVLDPSSTGFSGQSRSSNYESLMDAMFANGITTTFIGDSLWVPWFDRSDVCTVDRLHQGNSCNSGETIDFQNNCMVTDEFSQVGILVAMGNNQTRMDGFYNTVNRISSTFGQIPAWRIYRDGNTIEQCKQGINGNCDTASDATARIIIGLYTASNNTRFDAAARARYQALAVNITDDFIEYEMDNTCRSSNLGHGDICYWLAAGSRAKQGGVGTTDYGYTGYYADAIIALLQACSQTGNTHYCEVAGNITLNYLQASNFTTDTFRTPPGRSFKWVTQGGVQVAQCTNTCNPDQWDDADAVRATGMCQAHYYAQNMDYELPGLARYCELWGDKYMSNPTSAPLQYYANGTNSAGYQSGFFAQGLQALFLLGYNPSLVDNAIDSSLTHYIPATRTWDYTACFGIYQQAFPIRALGTAIGRDLASFAPVASYVPAPVNNTPINVTLPPANTTTPTNTTNQTTPSNVTPVNQSLTPTNVSFASIAPALSTTIAEPASATFAVTLSNPSNLSTTIYWYQNNVLMGGSTNATTFTVPGSYTSAGTYTITVRAISSQNTAQHTFNLVIIDTTQVTPELSEPEPEPKKKNGGGGGGGGRARQLLTQSANAVTAGAQVVVDTSTSLTSTVSNYFTGSTEMSNEELVHSLRTYYEENP